MLATLISAALVCLSALALGQGVLRLCGWKSWSWQAGPVGLSLLMLVAFPAHHLPGRSLTVAVAVALLTVAALVAIVRERELRPPLAGLLAAIPVLLLALVPYLSAGRSGTLGVSFNNDMSIHLMQAEVFTSATLERINGIVPSYPLGPHAVVALVVDGTGMAVDHAFAGFMIAVQLLIGWTALGFLRRAGWLAQTVIATLTSMTFLSAAFYAQASFKETVLALLMLGFTLALAPDGRSAGALRWVPAALCAGGIVAVYSVTGLLWPVAVLGVWLAGLVVTARKDRVGATRRAVRGETVGLAVALAVLAVLLVPQVPRVIRFFKDATGIGGTGLDTTALGNLVGRLPFWEAFGIWDNADFRMPPADPLTIGAWAGIVLLLALAANVWWAKRGDWFLPAATFATFLVWVFSDRTQSPYISSKALAIFAVFVILLAVRPLVERASWPERCPGWLRVAAPLAAAVLAFSVLGSSWSALRTSFVGPRDHMLELRSLRPLLGTDRTLFVGNDDFIRWELAGVPVDGPVIVSQRLPMREQKEWTYGEPLDVDAVDATTLNEYRWLVMPRDAAGSVPPKQFRLARSTRNYDVWERTGTVVQRELLAERAGAPGARLDCSLPDGRALSRQRGVAGIRRPSVGVPAPAVAAGESAEVELRLGAGTWDLQAPYVSSVAIEVTGPGLRTRLVPNLDRPGNRWPIGRVRLDRAGDVKLRLAAEAHAFTPEGAAAQINAIVATPQTGERVVPLSQACGRYVDWYRLTP